MPIFEQRHVTIIPLFENRDIPRKMLSVNDNECEDALTEKTLTQML